MIKFPFGKSKKDQKEEKEKAEKKPKKKTSPKKSPSVSQKEQAAQILLSPHISEKALRMQNKGRYTFRVAKKANKIEVRKAVHNLYNVDVKSVNIINVPRKKRSIRRQEGYKAGYKKAIVTLEEGQSIDELRI